MSFKDRREELDEIGKLLSSERFEFLILYGRRRIGKTMLALEAVKAKHFIYYLAERIDNLHRFYEECSRVIPTVQSLKEDYHTLLDFLKDKVDVIIIDEFPYMIAEDENVLNIFQAEIDQHLKASKLKLVISGSSVSFMTSNVLANPSPLFGRKTSALKLAQISFVDLPEFFPNASFEELVEIHGFAGGIPYYLDQIDPNVPFWSWLEQILQMKTCFLRDEMDFLLRYEFIRPETYMRILNAIALGNTKLSEIANFTRMKATDLPPYISTLIEVDFVAKSLPIGDSPHSRTGRYYLTDNFVKFWFRFIFPHLSQIEQGIFNVRAIQDDYSPYLGHIFEEVVQQFLVKTQFFPFSNIGRWWWRGEEIDLVAINSESRVLYFVECKWSVNVNARAVARKLAEKVPLVRIDHDTDHYVIFAKSFSKRVDDYEGVPVTCFDLIDMELEMGHYRNPIYANGPAS